MSQKDNALETYVKLIDTDYKPALERFSRVLLRLGMPADEVQQASNAFEWEVDDICGVGWVHGWDIADFKITGAATTLYPFFTGYIPRIDDATADNWIHCGFWMDSPHLIPRYVSRGHVPLHYPAEAQQLITTLARAMHQEFAQATVYFTDDSQEADILDAVVKNEASKKWRFHYALFPLEPHSAYTPFPTSHAGRFGGGCFEAWNRKMWPQFES